MLALAFGVSFAAEVRMNQLGFFTGGTKTAVLQSGTGDPVEVRQGASVVLSVTPSDANVWAPSGETVRQVDFSALATAGTYALYQGGAKISSDFAVADKPYSNVLDASLKFFYFQRASTALLAANAGVYARAAGHPDTKVQLHSSTGETGTISSPKGWYDAGDYGKYIVNSGISTYTLLALYEQFPTFFATRTWNIPESGNSTPDLLDEIRWNLDWMLTMQSASGAVYHKLSSLGFPGTTMPAKDDAGTRYAIGKSTAASFDFAAVMAMASRVYLAVDPAFASQCYLAARRAYDWAMQNPNEYFSNPSDVSTGEYGDGKLSDEQFWASVEMHLASQDKSNYLDNAKSVVEDAGTPDWGSVNTLGYYTAATHASAFGGFQQDAQAALLTLANKLLAQAQSSGYGIAMQSSDFVWGSNGTMANQGIVLLHAYYLTGDVAYLHVAQQHLDYILGRNPLKMSYVSGIGTKSPLNPHHRPSQADGITAPVPGMLAGGPHTGGQDIGAAAWNCANYISTPAQSYFDNACSYATNEVAINWNAPLAYLTGALEALAEGAPIPELTGKDFPAPLQGAIAHKVPVQSTRIVFNGTKVGIVRINDLGVTMRYDLHGKQIQK